MTLCYVMSTFLCTFSACYAMRSVMSQIDKYDDDDDCGGKLYILLFNSSVKFHAKVCMCC